MYVRVCIFISNDKGSPNTASVLSQAEIACEARCTPPKAGMIQIHNKKHTIYTANPVSLLTLHYSHYYITSHQILMFGQWLSASETESKITL